MAYTSVVISCSICMLKQEPTDLGINTFDDMCLQMVPLQAACTSHCVVGHYWDPILTYLSRLNAQTCIDHGWALQVNSAENRCLINPKSDTVVEKGDQLIMMSPPCIASHSYKALPKPVKADIGESSKSSFALISLSHCCIFLSS